MEKKETVILSLGGSLIVPQEIDINFLNSFKEFICSKIQCGKRFVIVCGGGKTARKYQRALKELNSNTNKTAADWVGIASTKLNAELIKQFFGDLVCEEIILDPNSSISFDKPILIGAGFLPGHSTDYDTVLFAEKFKASKIINLSNIEYLYDKDPKHFKDAKKIEKSTWDSLLKILPNKWEPGLNSPFDPIAARKAKELNLELAIISGKNLSQLSLFIENKRFIGTYISH